MNEIELNIIEDESVKRKMEQTSQMLNKKFNKKHRKINENKLFKKATKTQKVFTVIIDSLCAIMVILGMIFCVSGVNCRLQNVAPSFAGYTNCKVKSPSMTKSGFEIGDCAVVRSVDPKSLRGASLNPDGSVAQDENGNYLYGDIIAFYCDNSNQDAINSFVQVKEFSQDLEFKHSFGEFFGVRNEQMVKCAKAGGEIYFHHIVRVFEDKDGVRWFETQGSSNAMADQSQVLNSDGTINYLNCGYVSEKMVLGVYDNSANTKFVSLLLTAISSNVATLIIVLIPLLFLAVLLIIECGNDVRLAIIECEVVDGTRKLTEEVCVKNHIGFNLSKKDKLKVLSHTPSDEINETIALMWKDGSAPTAIKKYYLKKRLMLRPMIEKNALMAKCKQMKEQGKTDKQIAAFYLSESKRIEKTADRLNSKLKYIRKSNLKKSAKPNSQPSL